MFNESHKPIAVVQSNTLHISYCQCLKVHIVSCEALHKGHAVKVINANTSALNRHTAVQTCLAGFPTYMTRCIHPVIRVRALNTFSNSLMHYANRIHSNCCFHLMHGAHCNRSLFSPLYFLWTAYTVIKTCSHLHFACGLRAL